MQKSPLQMNMNDNLSPTKIIGILEAVLFVSGDAVHISELAEALKVPQESILLALSEAENVFRERGVVIKRHGEHLRLETNADYSPYIERLLQPVQRQNLSQTIMETLAVIAYRQPCTKGDIEQIRGVKCDYSVQSLLAKGLICDAGRKETLGRPILYATTDLFLEHFGISDIRELPPLPQNQEEKSEPLVP